MAFQLVFLLRWYIDRFLAYKQTHSTIRVEDIVRIAQQRSTQSIQLWHKFSEFGDFKQMEIGLRLLVSRSW